MAKDLDPKPEGRRLRINFTRYNKGRKYFDTIKGAALVCTVADAAEEKALIGKVEGAVREFLDARADGSADSGDSARAAS